jgi:acyl dehydratase
MAPSTSSGSGASSGSGLTDLTVGDVVAEASYLLTRDSLVRYAGASGDFNPIHYRDAFALGVGLDGVIAHGMLTMGVAVQPVVEWLGAHGIVVDYQSKFTRPVLVDAEVGATITVVAKVGAVDDEGVRIDLAVTFNEATVLGRAQVRVALAAA